MARRNNNMILLIAGIAAVIAFACWMMLRKSDNSGNSGDAAFSAATDSDVQFIDAPSFSEHTFEGPEGGCDDPEFIEHDPETGMNAGELSVGVGPGLWGSGRHTSELYGN